MQLVAAHEERSLHIDAHTARTRWRGEPMDYGLAIDVLIHRANKARASADPDPISVTGS